MSEQLRAALIGTAIGLGYAAPAVALRAAGADLPLCVAAAVIALVALAEAPHASGRWAVLGAQRTRNAALAVVALAGIAVSR